MQKRLNVRIIFLIVLTLCLAPALTGQNTGLAQNAEPIQFDSPLPEPDPIILEYARTLGLSNEEAGRRLKLQNEMDALESKIREGEPMYAGSWTVHQPNFGLVVAFASPNGEEKIRKYLDGNEWANLVSVQQLPFTIDELRHISNQVHKAAQDIGIPFESSANFPTGKVKIWTAQPEELRRQLEVQEATKQYIDDITFIYREFLSAPAQLKYPYLMGGHHLSTCTTGFVLTRNSDGRRFMSTAGHCDNNQDVQYNNINSIFLGPLIFENDPEHDPPGSNNNIDLQVHDVSARSFDLTNVIRTNTTTTASVIAYELKANTQGDWVCKYGRSTALVCGWATDIDYSPSFAPGDRFVLVENYALVSDIACGGDSGGPVFKFITGGVQALGILSGVAAPVNCNGTHRYFFYSPVDEIQNVHYNILTSHYQQRYLQNVFWTETNCREYIQPYDNNGNPSGGQTNSTCNTTAAPGTSTETIQTYTGYVMGNFWREGMWRNNRGYTRNVPLNSNGTVNWGAAPAWSLCCGPRDAPRSQDAYIIGNHWYQNVWWTETDCKEYKRALDNNGNPTGVTTEQACRTSLPTGISLTIQSYTAYPIGGNLREGMWRNGIGYVRTVPLNATNTDVDWNNAPAWSQCCTNNAPPRAQGGYVLSYP